MIVKETSCSYLVWIITIVPFILDEVVIVDFVGLEDLMLDY